MREIIWDDKKKCHRKKTTFEVIRDFLNSDANENAFVVEFLVIIVLIIVVWLLS